MRALGVSSVVALACADIAQTALAADAASPLPLRSASSFDGWTMALKAIAVAVVCLAIAAVVLHRMKNRGWVPLGGAAMPAVANVQWAKRISPRTTLMVVKWQGKHYLLAENGATTALLDTRAADEPAS